MVRSRAAISARRAMVAWSGAGISMRPRYGSSGPASSRAPRRALAQSGLEAKARPRARLRRARGESSALASLEARIGLVDDVEPALAPHDAARLMALLGRLERIDDLHDRSVLEDSDD